MNISILGSKKAFGVDYLAKRFINKQDILISLEIACCNVYYTRWIIEYLIIFIEIGDFNINCVILNHVKPKLFDIIFKNNLH